MKYKSVRIKLTNAFDLTELARQAEQVNGDVIIKSGNRYIDAASLLGLVGIASREALIILYPEDAIDFDNFIKKYI